MLPVELLRFLIYFKNTAIFIVFHIRLYFMLNAEYCIEVPDTLECFRRTLKNSSPESAEGVEGDTPLFRVELVTMVVLHRILYKKELVLILYIILYKTIGIF